MNRIAKTIDKLNQENARLRLECDTLKSRLAESDSRLDKTIMESNLSRRGDVKRTAVTDLAGLLLSSDGVTVGRETGKIKGMDSIMKDLRKTKPFYFTNSPKANYVTPFWKGR